MHFWDLLLIMMVSLQVVLAAYLYEPKWKAIMLTLPCPFTFASLSVGQPMSAVNVFAMIAMFLFMQTVRWLHVNYRFPIYFAIGLSVFCYICIGSMLSSFIPKTELWFWISCIVVFVFAFLMYSLLPAKAEIGDRTTLPIWLKLPLTVLLVSGLIWIKPKLLGAMTFFPMVGVFIAYEARKSLWTMGRQNAIVILTVLPMVITVHLCSPWIGLGFSLIWAWVIFLIGFSIIKYVEYLKAREKLA